MVNPRMIFGVAFYALNQLVRLYHRRFPAPIQVQRSIFIRLESPGTVLPCPPVGEITRLYGLLKRKNRLPVGGVMVTLLVPPAVLMVPP